LLRSACDALLDYINNYSRYSRSGFRMQSNYPACCLAFFTSYLIQMLVVNLSSPAGQTIESTEPAQPITQCWTALEPRASIFGLVATTSGHSPSWAFSFAVILTGGFQGKINHRVGRRSGGAGAAVAFCFLHPRARRSLVCVCWKVVYAD
jgi:hypothetical protein